METIQTIHLEGFITSDDGIEFKGDHVSIAERIERNINVETELSKHHPDDDYQTELSSFLPKVSLRMYFSDNQISLEEAKEKLILDSIGALDIYQEWYGYSEWTIMGYSVINFTIGNHDLETILETYIGKYVHIVMEILE